MNKSVLIIGAGCFGVTAAKELRGRGYKVCTHTAIDCQHLARRPHLDVVGVYAGNDRRRVVGTRFSIAPSGRIDGYQQTDTRRLCRLDTLHGDVAR